MGIFEVENKVLKSTRVGEENMQKMLLFIAVVLFFVWSP